MTASRHGSSAGEHEIARFVPDLARTREAGITLEVSGLFGLFHRDLVADDAAWRPLAALRVDARVQSRAVRERRAALPVHIAAATRGVPEPAFGVEQRVLVPNGPGDEVACTECTYGEGRVLCSACGATGQVLLGGLGARESCRACQGAQSIPCSRCEGLGRVWAGPVIEVDDRHAQLHHVYAPEVSLELQEGIARAIDTDAPECLRVSLEPRVVDPYRGTLAGHTIAGHTYDRAIAFARSAIGSLAGEGEAIRSEIALHAWPYLFARAGRIEAALLVDPTGVLRCVRAEADAV